MGYKSIEARIQSALPGFRLSFTLSLLGFIVEFLVVSLFAFNVLLIADLGHWLIDTILEGLFLVFVTHASKIRRVFPLSTVILESLLVTTVAFIMAGLYGYFLVDYFLSIRLEEISGVYHPILALVPVLGGVLTGITMTVQRRLYSKLRLEILKVDYIHAVVDTVAALLAVIGILTVSYYQNPGIEAIFVVVLSFFVYHSIIEVLKDTVKTAMGRNIDPDLKIRVYDKLIKTVNDVHIRDVDARKVGSFYIVIIKCEVDPRLTIKEAHRLRTKIIEITRETSDLIYHVDVFFYPKRKAKRRQ